MGSARAEMTKDAGEYLVTQAATRPTNDAGQDGGNNSDILVVARQQVLQRGEGLNQDQVLAVCSYPTTGSRSCWRWPTRCGWAGADPRSRSKASSA